MRRPRQCITCGSYALNIEKEGPYCDVCHWRNLFEIVLGRYEALSTRIDSASDIKLATRFRKKIQGE